MFEVTEIKTQRVNISKLIAFWENIASERTIKYDNDKSMSKLSKIEETNIVNVYKMKTTEMDHSSTDFHSVDMQKVNSEEEGEKTITPIEPSVHMEIKELGLPQEIINVGPQIEYKQEVTGVLVLQNTTYIQEISVPRSVKTMFLAVHHLDTTDEIQRENEYLARIYQENPKLVKVRGRRKGKVTFMLPEVFADILYEGKDIVDH